MKYQQVSILVPITLIKFARTLPGDHEKGNCGKRDQEGEVRSEGRGEVRSEGSGEVRSERRGEEGNGRKRGRSQTRTNNQVKTLVTYNTFNIIARNFATGTQADLGYSYLNSR